MRKILFLGLTVLAAVGVAFAQPTTFPVNGPANKNQPYTAFTNANVFTDYQTLQRGVTLLIKDNKIEAIGTAVALPPNTVVYNLNGKYIYPAFIDVYSTYGMPDVEKGGGRGRGPQYEKSANNTQGWNPAIRSDVNANELFTPNDKKAAEYRKNGFGAVLTQQADGIARGTAAFVALADKEANLVVYKPQAATGFSFSKGSSTLAYPSSQMGSIALLRQTLYDAQWYKAVGKNQEYNSSLEALNTTEALPAFFSVGDKLSALRANKVGKEFGLKFIIVGDGDEYQRVAELKTDATRLVVPVNFPDAFEVVNPAETDLIPLTDMKHWELAPANPYFLNQNGVPFALTSAGLKESNLFLKNIRKALENGLPYTEALKALTFTPADYVGMGNTVGSIKPGYSANFFITNDSLFTNTLSIAENWCLGERYVYEDVTLPVVKGSYKATLTTDASTPFNFDLIIKGTNLKPNAEAKQDSLTFSVDMFRDANMLVMFGDLKKLGLDAKYNLNTYITKTDAANHAQTLTGDGTTSTGSKISFVATFVNDTIKPKKPDNPFKVTKPEAQPILPFAAYGRTVQPTANNYLLTNATVWTNEADSIIENADVLIENGKIKAVGKNLAPLPNTTRVDATGMHITPGIVDEHSHIAISKGVNEGGQSVTSEVSIGDVVNPDDVNIYRQLSGGVTAAQLLHGSANCIGGQSAIIKLRWGQTGEAMKIATAPGFIKFALGENVKQSNWGDTYTNRYPQTRMGVEQTFADAFIRAREYKAAWSAFSSFKPNKRNPVVAPLQPRKDLELDALVEILDGKRFITCHSYVQSEINMLMRLGDSLGFKVNTFTHILEGYKLADKMKAHGAAASTFSDWWAYKFEVNDAIPYNAAVLTRMGVLTGINSDDAEMARRLNQEAAKAIKYGGLTQVQALKLVTLNPAKMLHIDNVTGSLKPGKDADVVIWTANPLSIYAKVAKTFVDGVLLFDAVDDVNARKAMAAERLRLINKMAEAAKKGERTRKPQSKDERFYHCNTIGEDGELSTDHNEH